MRLTRIITKFNQEFELNQLNLLVGPNNSGKSQFLHDVFRSVGHMDKNTVILKDYDFNPPNSFNDLIEGLKFGADENNPSREMLRGMGPSLSDGISIDIPPAFKKESFDKEHFRSYMSYFGRFQIAYLDTTSRLTMALTKESGDMSNSIPPQNLLQSLYLNGYAESELRQVFGQAFRQDILLDHSGLRNLRLRVGEKFDIPNQRENLDFIQKNPTLDVQGDGMKSFVSVILSFILAKNRILLIDEPEAFLHASQQRILGTWIAEYSKRHDTQVIISTHSSNFLTGILSSDIDVNIMRLNRTENITRFNVIKKEIIQKLSSNPLLSSQPVLESIFYKGVVVCEADADRILYQYIVTRELKEQDVLFIHSYGKDKAHEFVEILKNSFVPVHLIIDFDVLNDEYMFQRLLSSFNLSDMELNLLRKKIADYIELENEYDIINRIISELKLYLDNLKNNDDNVKTLTVRNIKRKLKNIISIPSKWENYKKQGVYGFKGDIISDIEKLIFLCEKSGMYIVPCGELESWIKLDIKNKNKWLIKALDIIGKNNCPESLQEFLQKIIKFNY